MVRAWIEYGSRRCKRWLDLDSVESIEMIGWAAYSIMPEYTISAKLKRDGHETTLLSETTEGTAKEIMSAIGCLIQHGGTISLVEEQHKVWDKMDRDALYRKHAFRAKV